MIGRLRQSSNKVLFTNLLNESYLPGEPVLVRLGDKYVVGLNNSLLRPNEVGEVTVEWTAEFEGTTNLLLGDIIYWDVSQMKISDTKADFILGSIVQIDQRSVTVISLPREVQQAGSSPSWIIEPQDAEFDVGDDFIIPALAGGLPSPNYQWYEVIE